MTTQLRILIVEDSPTDAELALRELKRAGLVCDARRVETADDYRRVLAEFKPELILSDFTMPHFDGMRALTIARESDPDVPFIFLSGTIGEEHAIRALKNGATDYVLKSNRVRLPAAVERAANESYAHSERRNTERELAEVRERLQSIVSTLRDVVWSVEIASRKLLYVSPSITNIFKRSETQFYANSVLWGDAIHPDDRARVVSEWDKAALSGVFDCEHRILLPDGDVRWIHSRGQSTGKSGDRIDRIDGVAQDITVRRGQQEKLARLSRILVKVMRGSVAGKRRISPRLVDLLECSLDNPAQRLAHEQLSEREMQIMLLIGSGKSVKQIGGELSISVNTVNTHRARILKKMDMRTNAALIRYAVEQGLVE